MSIFKKKIKQEKRWTIEHGELVFYNEHGFRIPHISIDEKPIENVPNFVIVHEEDTGYLYAFNADEKCWIKL